MGWRRAARWDWLGGSLLASLLAVAAAGCGSQPPPAPSPVIELSPSQVCLGDDHQTPIVIDGTDSAPQLTLVPTAPRQELLPLESEWRFSGSEVRITEGSVDDLEVTVTMLGDRPLHVTLWLRNAAGGEAEAQASVAVTAPGPDGTCPEVP